MKIVRSIGESRTYTESDSASSPLRTLVRGVIKKPEKRAIPAASLPNFLRNDPRLAIRQTISVLDKTVKKRNRLSQLHHQAYVDRALLGEVLWDRISGDFPDAEIGELRQRWQAKVHPYAVHSVDTTNPAGDQNAAIIVRTPSELTREDFRGRWHDIFWREKGSVADYGATADAILAHLHDQERTLRITDGGARPRLKDGAPSDSGLVAARARSIARGTSDPREGRKANPAKDGWDEKAESTYFATDIARAIRDACLASPPPQEVIDKAFVGRLLYEHFGGLSDKTEAGTEARRALWYLHNAVRNFYRILSGSERFRRAVKERSAVAVTAQVEGSKKADEKAPSRLERLLPLNREALLRAMGARDRNARLSELIRLGKLVAHASDISPAVAQDATLFPRRMDWFATSDGQSAIKRNEAFVRVWRNAVGQSFGTLRPLVDPMHAFGDLSGNTDRDDRQSESRLAALNLDVAAFRRQLKLVFGGKRHSRLAGGEDDDVRELAWALVRLASTVRNRTSHFMIKPRLLELVRRGILLPPDEDHPLRPLDQPQRPGERARADILHRFGELLEFDEALDRRRIVDQLVSLDAGTYLSRDRIDAIVAELVRTDSEPDLLIPRFMATMKKATGLAMAGGAEAPMPEVGSAELSDVPRTDPLNRLKIGLLGMLYRSGFQQWLAENDGGGEALTRIVTGIINSKQKRIDAAANEERRIYSDVESFLRDNGLGGFETLKDLLGELQRLGMQANGDHLRYRADRKRQGGLSRRIEAFRQEIVAVLFDRYLQDRDISWIWDLAGEPETLTDLESMDIPAVEARGDGTTAAQVYAWLHLLPVETVARLRHQFRKTMMLEKKGSAAPLPDGSAPACDLPATAGPDDKELIETMDRLMALYIRVQATGFDGDEHKVDHGLGALLYEDEGQFGRVFSDAGAHHDESIAGTRRGLREILRFGHLPVLTPIFQRHKVTIAEVNAQIERDPATDERFKARQKLHDRIVALSEANPVDQDALTAACAQYAAVATECALHNFSVRAARLDEHIRAHHLLMAAVGRLVDFTLMWERDRFYLLLGLLYRRWNGHVTLWSEGQKIGIEPSEWSEPGDKPHIVLWDSKDGFALHREHRIAAARDLLDPDAATLFRTHFPGRGEAVQNVRDRAAIAKRTRREQASRFADGGKQIRNDFAHYNVLTAARKRPINLSYLVNAVRSLFGYDRKLKNAVPRAIADVLRREGVEIEWQLAGDRLKHPRVLPVVETHLSMVCPRPDRKIPVLIPRTSIRFVSMVKGLFDFDPGGYRQLVWDGKKESRKGQLRYPGDLFARHGVLVPGPFYQWAVDRIQIEKK